MIATPPPWVRNWKNTADPRTYRVSLNMRAIFLVLDPSQKLAKTKNKTSNLFSTHVARSGCFHESFSAGCLYPLSKPAQNTHCCLQIFSDVCSPETQQKQQWPKSSRVLFLSYYHGHHLRLTILGRIQIPTKLLA